VYNATRIERSDDINPDLTSIGSWPVLFLSDPTSTANFKIRNLQQIQFASRVTAVLLAFFLPFGVWAVLNLPIGSAGVHEWLPEGRPERERYERFIQEFGNDQVVLMSWDGCRIDDPRLAIFQDRLKSHPSFGKFIATLESSDQLMAQLTAPPLKLSRERAMARLRGVMIGPDETAAVLARISPQGVAHQGDTIAMIHSAADATEGLNRTSLRLAGTVYEAFAVDEAAEASLKRLVVPSSILGMLAAWFCLRQFRRAVAVLLLAAIGQLLAVAMVYYTGNRFSAVLIVLPTLVFMLTLSGAVHLMNYHADSLRHGNGQYAGAKAMLLGWKPCTLSSITTMLGMGSLLTSQLAPVRQFGLFSAVGLGTATVVLLLGFPAIVDWFCATRRQSSSDDTTTLTPDNTKRNEDEERNSNFTIGYLAWLTRNATLISVVGISVLLITGVGLIYLKASTKFSDMFPIESKTNQDMAWIEQHVGPIATVEVLLKFPNDSSLTELDRAGWVLKVSNKLLEQEVVGGVFSATSFLPTWSESSAMGATVKRAVMRKAIVNAIPSLQAKGLVAQSDDGETWRILAKVSATSDEDYGQLTRAVAAATESILRETTEETTIYAEYTGLSPVMHETQVALLTDLGYSFASAFLLITPVMMFIARSVRGGLLLMLPNVLPVTIAFGCMGWLGLDLDIAGILTASIALGIAVDDTLHFFCWYMDELRNGYSSRDAVARTFHSCAAAMIHTTLISCLSMVPFLFAEFIPTQQFAKLMIVMLSGAVLGDLVLLPAMLLSPLGKVIQASKQRMIEAIEVTV
jgi:predicted RND superfamily exporter protein